MKAKWIGLLLLIVVALGAVGYVWFSPVSYTHLDVYKRQPLRWAFWRRAAG